jgi:hypothetical protein
MFFDWQLLVALALVAAAGCYLARRAWRTWTAKRSGCGGSCGCTGNGSAKESTSLVSREELLSRLKQSR